KYKEIRELIRRNDIKKANERIMAELDYLHLFSQEMSSAANKKTIDSYYFLKTGIGLLKEEIEKSGNANDRKTQFYRDIITAEKTITTAAEKLDDMRFSEVDQLLKSIDFGKLSEHFVQSKSRPAWEEVTKNVFNHLGYDTSKFERHDNIDGTVSFSAIKLNKERQELYSATYLIEKDGKVVISISHDAFADEEECNAEGARLSWELQNEWRKKGVGLVLSEMRSEGKNMERAASLLEAAQKAMENLFGKERVKITKEKGSAITLSATMAEDTYSDKRPKTKKRRRKQTTTERQTLKLKE
ncbi:MAG: hypothetical protein AB1798_17630, partial [Spirochaetota bacterium]